MSASLKCSRSVSCGSHTGPRTCLGTQLAYMEAKVVMAALYSKFKLRLLPSPPVVIKRGVMLTTEHGVHVRVENL